MHQYCACEMIVKRVGFNYFLFLFLIGISNVVQAQSIRVLGRIFDATSSKPVEFAIVSALSKSDSLLGGGLSQGNGDFMLENISRQASQIRIQFIGYETQVIPLKTVASVSLYDLGNIRLKVNQQQLKELVIEGEKSQMTLGIDRRIYQVDKDLSARGGTALDAMKNIPGITVGSDNSVQLRNQGPTIFIDGRPSLLSLDQIPADDIDRIEVITNPSVKYSASTTGGILNVVLKKNLRPGYFGSLSAGIGSNNRYSTNGNISIREKKLSIQVSGNYGASQNQNNGYTHRENFSNGQTAGKFNLDNTNLTSRWNSSGRIAADYKINVRSLLSANYNYSENGVDANENQNYSTSDSSTQIINSGYRNNELKNNWKVHSAQILFKKNYPKIGKELSADLGMTHSDNYNYSLFDTHTTLDLLNPDFISNEKQNNTGNRSATLYNGQIDYSNPLTSNSRLDWGGRFAYKQSFSDFEVNTLDPNTNISISDTGLSNKFRVDDFIGAAYVNYAGKLGPFMYQAGMRYEHTWFVAESQKSGQEYSYIYPKSVSDLDKVLFPAIYFSKKIKENHEFQLNFSRKIGRPGYMQLIPFITYADRQSVQIGNPVLGPEFINLAELNYSFQGNKSSVLSGIYTRQTLQAITTVLYKSPTNPDILVSTFGNGKDKFDLGWENTFKQKLFTWLDFSLNTNVFYSKISLEQNGILSQNEGFSWNAKSMFSVKASKKLSFQLNGSYEAPRIIPQGTINAIWFSDISCSININKKLSASATLSDVFNTKRYGTNYQSASFNQDIIRRWETRYFRMNITWKFGEPDVSLFRRRNNSRREPGSGGTEMQEL